VTDYSRLLIQAYVCTFSHHQHWHEILTTTTAAAAITVIAISECGGSGEFTITNKHGSMLQMNFEECR
jgi:hypothetical protein